MRTQLKTTQEASQYSTKPFVPSCKVKTEAEVSLSFKIWKLLSHASVHSNVTLFWVKFVKVHEMDTSTSTNVVYYITKPNKFLMSHRVNGLGQILTAFIFFGLTSILSLEII